MKASQIKKWPSQFSPDEWPAGTLDHMSASLLTECVFPLRVKLGSPMSPSTPVDAHVRFEGSVNSQHYAVGRLSTATDMMVSDYAEMIQCMYKAESIDAIGGIGIYFDTHNPLVHIDERDGRLVWLARKDKDGNREYIYRENNPALFYELLGKELEKVIE